MFGRINLGQDFWGKLLTANSVPFIWANIGLFQLLVSS